MSRHLDRTGPNMTKGNRSWFYQTEKEAKVPASSVFICPSHTAPRLKLSQVRRVCSSCVTGPDLTLAARRVTSTGGLSLPLCSHLCVLFPLTLFSYSS